MQPLNVTLVQCATHWHDASANRAMFDELISSVASDTHLIVLPEMFSTGFTMDSSAVAEHMSGETVAWMQQAALSNNKAICGSVVIEEQGAFYNRFLCALPDETLVVYDKRHRFRMAGEHEHYQAGESQVVFEYLGWRICPMICYDLRFPVWLRNSGGYDLLLCVANWPAARQLAWNTLLRARAIENQSYVCGVNIVGEDGNGVTYSGGSAVYAPDGETLAEVFDAPEVLNLTLDANVLEVQRTQFPVWQDADNFQLTP